MSPEEWRKARVALAQSSHCEGTSETLPVDLHVGMPVPRSNQTWPVAMTVRGHRQPAYCLVCLACVCMAYGRFTGATVILKVHRYRGSCCQHARSKL